MWKLCQKYFCVCWIFVCLSAYHHMCASLSPHRPTQTELMHVCLAIHSSFQPHFVASVKWDDLPSFHAILYSGPLRIHAVTKLAAGCKQKHMPISSSLSFCWRGCPRLSVVTTRHGPQSVKCALSTPTPVVDLGRVIFIRSRPDLLIWSSLFPVTMLCFTGTKAHWKELRSLRCVSWASAKAPITSLVSWCS